jgi:hypothetical protein
MGKIWPSRAGAMVFPRAARQSKMANANEAPNPRHFHSRRLRLVRASKKLMQSDGHYDIKKKLVKLFLGATGFWRSVPLGKHI